MISLAMQKTRKDNEFYYIEEKKDTYQIDVKKKKWNNTDF